MKTTNFLLTIMTAVILFTGCGKDVDPPHSPATYEVSVTAGAGGSASADKTSAEQDKAITIMAVAGEGYEFREWTVTDGNITLLPNAQANPATFIMPASNVEIRAEFDPVCAVTITAGTGGTASADKKNPDQGETVTITAVAEDGYTFSQWTVTEGTITLSPDAQTNPATFVMSGANVAVRAEFDAIHPVTVTAAEGGTASADKTSVMQGETVTLTAVADEGYRFREWTIVDGDATLSPNSKANPATFTMPAGSVAVRAEFDVTYKVNTSSFSGGSVRADKTSAVAGETVTLTAAVEVPGYIFDKWITNSDITLSPDIQANPVTFIMPAADVLVVAHFVDLRTVINGVTWATRNVDAPGTFSSNIEDAGMLYQWNRRTGWSSTNPLTSSPAGQTWDNSIPAGSSWESANDPCPAGWRLPTKDEMAKLLATAKVSNMQATHSGVYGRIFTDKTSGDNVFFPAAGYRDKGSTGSLSGAGSDGFYWTSSSEPVNKAWRLNFSSNSIALIDTDRTFGFSVRCVLKQ